LLYQFVAHVLPKYSDPAKTPDQMKEKILDEVVGRYLGLFFAAVCDPRIFYALKSGSILITDFWADRHHHDNIFPNLY